MINRKCFILLLAFTLVLTAGCSSRDKKRFIEDMTLNMTTMEELLEQFDKESAVLIINPLLVLNDAWIKKINRISEDINQLVAKVNEIEVPKDADAQEVYFLYIDYLSYTKSFTSNFYSSIYEGELLKFIGSAVGYSAIKDKRDIFYEKWDAYTDESNRNK